MFSISAVFTSDQPCNMCNIWFSQACSRTPSQSITIVKLDELMEGRHVLSRPHQRVQDASKTRSAADRNWMLGRRKCWGNKLLARCVAYTMNADEMRRKSSCGARIAFRKSPHLVIRWRLSSLWNNRMRTSALVDDYREQSEVGLDSLCGVQTLNASQSTFAHLHRFGIRPMVVCLLPA